MVIINRGCCRSLLLKQQPLLYGGRYMLEKEQFMKLMKDIVDIAKTNGGTITTEDIKSCFADKEFSEEQLNAIYDYMHKNNISVKG